MVGDEREEEEENHSIAQIQMTRDSSYRHADSLDSFEHFQLFTIGKQINFSLIFFIASFKQKLNKLRRGKSYRHAAPFISHTFREGECLRKTNNLFMLTCCLQIVIALK